MSMTSLNEENQRYGRNKSTLVNTSYINSGEYRKKFDTMTGDEKVNRILYSKAKEILTHRSGTEYEDMYWIGSDGETVASEKNMQVKRKIIYSKATKDAIIKRVDLIALYINIHQDRKSQRNCLI